MGNTIIIGGPSIGFPSLGGLNFGGGSDSGSSLTSGLGFGSGLGSIFGGGLGGNIPGLQGTMFKLGFDALTGNLGGIMQDIADLGNLLSNFAGKNNNASQVQPLPVFGSGDNSGSPFTNTSNGNSSCCGGDNQNQTSQDQRTNDLLKQVMQMFGSMLQMFSQLLGLMLNSSGNNRQLQNSLSVTNFSSFI
jgi:hypothetical protein